MNNNYILKLNNLIGVKFTKNIYSKKLAIARSILALGTLLTLLFNPISNIIYQTELGIPQNPIILEENIVNKINFFLLFGIENANYSRILAIIILLIVIIGYYPRFSSILHWWVTWSFMLVTSAIDGGDQIAANVTLLMLPIFLMDSRKNHWNINKDNIQKSIKYLVANFMWFTIRMQAFVIYFHASIGKMFAKEWVDGTAVYYWFNHPTFGMPKWISPFLNYFLKTNYGVVSFTYGTIIFEILLFMTLFMDIKYRKYFFPFAVFFHSNIIIIHGIFSFFFSMLSLLMFYLLDLEVKQKNNQIS